MRHRATSVRLHGTRYCGIDCLHRALIELLEQTRPGPARAAIASHRVPLGLILLSRQQLTAEQLRTALAAQRNAGNGRIGDWVQELGFVTELEVTVALGRQWSCPVLLTEAAIINPRHYPSIPLPLLESFQMVPVDLVQSTRTLLIAFSEGIDYGALYAIEQMLGYHTEPCLVTDRLMRESLLALARIRQSDDVVFDRVEDAECAQIISSYAANTSAEEIRLARCGMRLWVRLQRAGRDAVSLVLTAPERQRYVTLPSAVDVPPV
jgi:hypothetical protein